jgi:hypothetical protein
MRSPELAQAAPFPFVSPNFVTCDCSLEVRGQAKDSKRMVCDNFKMKSSSVPRISFTLKTFRKRPHSPKEEQ